MSSSQSTCLNSSRPDGIADSVPPTAPGRGGSTYGQILKSSFHRLTRMHDKLAANLRRVEEWGKTEGRSEDEIRVARTYYRQTLAFFQRCDGLLDYLGRDRK
jgi:hypothetical protein